MDNIINFLNPKTNHSNWLHVNLTAQYGLNQNFEVAFQRVQNFGSDVQDNLRWNVHLQVLD